MYVRTAASLVMVAGIACNSSDAANGIDATGCTGGVCVLADQQCPDGESVNGINADGTVRCVRGGGLQTQTCSAGHVVAGVRADGSLMCVDPFDGAKSCDAGQYMIGIDGAGAPLCAAVSPDVVRDYVNANCYLYVGWRDSCDSCVSEPAKIGRTRGDAAGCEVAGTDGSCSTFSLFGQEVEMASFNTDGDVNDDDKFWVSLKCK